MAVGKLRSTQGHPALTHQIMQRMVKLIVPTSPIRYENFLSMQACYLKDCPTTDILMVIEHPDPVYTCGRQSVNYALTEGPRLEMLGAKCMLVDRGGKVTWHGPGQISIYPLINLKNFKPSLHWYAERLEAVLIRACGSVGVKASRRNRTEEVGVWTEDAKIGFVGMRNRGWRTSFGASLNVCNDLSWFDHIVPCGLEDVQITSLSRELGKRVDIEQVKGALIEAFEIEFNAKCQI